MLDEGPTDDINVRFDAAKKKFSINFSKAKTKFCLSLNYNGDNNHFFVNGKTTYRFKGNNKMSIFCHKFA